MTLLDRLLQRWRFGKVDPYISHGARVLDIGCLRGDMFRRFEDRMGYGVGIDPLIIEPVEHEKWRLVPGLFPEDLPDDTPFDVISMLALLEHIPRAKQPRLVSECARRLRPGGYLVITVPSPVVDRILAVLVHLRLADGMSLEEHYGFRPQETASLFTGGEFALAKQRRFQFGINNLFVFRRLKGDA
jgi:SAM-dependent methyltransferase